MEREYLQKQSKKGGIEAAYAAKLYQEVLLAGKMLVDNREEENDRKKEASKADASFLWYDQLMIVLFDLAVINSTFFKMLDHFQPASCNKV